MVEKTEKEFKKWCNKNKFFCKKLLTHTSTGQGNNQEADFIVANDNNVFLVECKERHTNTFNFKDLTQEKKLSLVTKKTNAIKPIILIRFPHKKLIVKMNLNEYKKIKNNAYFKNGKPKQSINLNEIPECYKYIWKTLNL